MKKTMCLFVFLTVLGVQVGMCQARRMTGTVYNGTDNKALAGASVSVKGAREGVATDAGGKFALQVDENDVLVFSFVGMKTQEIPAKGKSEISVTLHVEARHMEEVIVVAYGTAAREEFSGAVSVVGEDHLRKIQSSNPLNALAGVIPGVRLGEVSGQPGSDVSLRIRGIGSINASCEPLIVLDGIPYDGALTSINPSDIGSMSVLKDAASSAIYGARGANGVILITTKTGKKGVARVTIDLKAGVNSRAVPEYDIMTSPQQYYETFWEALYNQSYYKSKTNAGDAGVASTYASGELIKKLGYNVYNVPDNELIGADGKLNPNAKLGNVVPEMGMLLPDNWGDKMFGKAVRQEYNASVSGGADKANYYMSFGYLNDKGYIVSSDFKRYSTRLNADYQAKSWLKVGGGAAYISVDSKTPDVETSSSTNMFYVSRKVAPIYPLYVRDDDGNVLYDERHFPVYDYGDRAIERPFMGMNNPLGTQVLNKNEYHSDILNGKAFADVTFLKDFKFTFRAGIDNANTKNVLYKNTYYGQYKNQGGLASIYNTRKYGLTMQEILNWTKKMGHHSLDVLAGHETYNYRYSYLFGSKQNFLLPTENELAGAISNPRADSYTHEYNTEGYLTRLQYSYDNRYYFMGSYRRDASSKFHPDNRWGNFWAVSGSWILSQERFLRDADGLDNLKFKISYGSQGNDNLLYNGITNFTPYLDQYKVVNNNDQIALNLYYKGNRDIKWETNYNLNTGVEFSLWDGRLTGGFDFFTRTTKDLLFYRPQTVSSGVTSYPDNVGDMRNTGFELEVGGDIIRTGNFRWKLGMNMAHYKNKILSLPGESSETGIIVGRYRRQAGGSAYEFHLREWAGVDPENGSALWWKNADSGEAGAVNGKVKTSNYQEATLYDMGSALPDIYGGVNSLFSYKGFELSVLFTYQLGGLVYDGMYAQLMSSGVAGTNWHKDIAKRWTPENRNSGTPRVENAETYANASSSRFLVSASCLSIQNIEIGYSIPQSWCRELGVTGLRVYGVADNLALFSKRKGMDPRQSWQGEARDSYSPLRTVSGGLSISF